ncbi:hypothetical protein GCM10011354_15100 [Egicoccus halophilus]|uniref:Diguanylate cyclase (GGDEF) domain-containing protein n=1 Tax=Egicoccus halophilus TaxID=1670830 RepID=A0A8J3A7J5_9ACTN|nr:hypothetical protein GCM10011354_15100 [Egicoccus halophilus]
MWIFTLLLAAVALALTVRYVAPLTLPGDHLQIPFWVFVPIFLVTELLVVHLYFGRSAHALSFSETPLVVGFVFLHPLGLIAARLLGSFAALTLKVRVPPMKLGFNLAVGWLETVVGLLVWHAVVGTADPLGPRGWIAALLAVIAADALSTLAFVVVLSLHEGSLQRETLDGLFVAGLRTAFTNASFGVIVATVIAVDWRGVWALAAVAVTLVLAYRAYDQLKRSHTQMEQVHAFGRAVEACADAEAVVDVLLEHSAHLLRAELVEVRLADGAEGPERRRRREDRVQVSGAPSADGPGLTTPVHLAASDSATADALATAWPGHDEALGVPLRGDDGQIVGELWAVDRLDDVSNFETADLRLLETLANQAAVAFQNRRLVDELRRQGAATLHQARHDDLTDLPNRAHFQERMREALADGGRAAVLLLDLDRFKEVNDTLGHHAGDQLLRQVAERLRACTPDCAVVARFGGDEYAVLAPGHGDEASARVVANQVLGAFEVPFRIDEVSLEVAVSVGLVLAPDHGDQPEVLVQRADVAMYQAKEHRTGVEVYAHERDPYSPRRLAMMNDLRGAIEAAALDVHYQPLVDLLTGGIRGLEALVRWEHPRHGPISPDEFIPLAEQTGLILPLTEAVLRAALQQCRAWHARNARVVMAVNVSARSLLDVDFPDLVERLLHESRMPAEVLTLEITETAMLLDSLRTKEILERLSGMGVKLAIDDFGTGFSSLARLKNLPVDELKIDRSFVSNMMVNADDRAIVQSTIDLGRNLGLLVVAEGVEDEETMRRLATLGCHVGQGYWFSRPLAAADLERWFRHTGAYLAV